MKIADFSVKHPATITILLIAVLVFGILSLLSLKQELFPTIELPSLLVITTYPGVGPEDIEQQITAVIEDRLSTLSGVNSIESESQDSLSMITIEFEYDENLDLRLPELREMLNNALPDLPEGISGTPMILKLNSNSLPVFSVSLESDIDPESLARFADEKVVPFISRISGVSNVRLNGEKEKIVEIRLHLSQLESKEVPVLDVYQLLRYSNVSYPAGTAIYRNNELQVRTVGEFSSIEEIENMVVGFKDSTYLRLKDVADVEIIDKKSVTYTTDGSEEILLLDVYRQSGADSIQLIRNIKKILDGIERENNGIVRFRIISDESRNVALALNSVRSAALTGALLAVIILFLFLHNTRTTFIIGVSIPLTVLLTFALMYIKGQSLNLMTMGGLTLAIGMMVDSSIVILENIHRHFDKGLSRKEAACKGASEVGGAVIASTTTSVSVFIPILFTRGITGIILKDASWTILYALSASLLVAVVIVPYLSSLLLVKEKPNRRIRHALSQVSERSTTRLSAAYRRALSWSLSNRGYIMILAMILLGISVLSTQFMGFEFIPSTDMNDIILEMETPPGYTLEKTREKTAAVDALIRELVPETDTSVYYVGSSSATGLTTMKNAAYGIVKLVEHSERSRSVHRIIRILQRRVPEEIPDIDITIKNGGFDNLLSLAIGGSGFMIELTGNDMEDLIRSGETVRELMKQDPNIQKAEINVAYDRQEIVADLSLDYMGNLGVTPYEAAVTGRIIFNGMETGVYRGNGESMDIYLDSDVSGEKITNDILNSMAIKTGTGQFVSFASFADLKTEPAVSSIHHTNKILSVVVTGYLKEGNSRGTSERIYTALKNMDLPSGISWRTVGNTAEMISSFKSLLMALLISVFLVYIVMVIQFERFIQPLIVMASVPFTFIGVVASMLVYGTSLNIISFMGIIALAGIVVNNAIVMIDYTNLLRKRDGLGITDAVVEGAGSRLKPILMTTLTTILGVIPMALGMGEGAEIYAPLGQAISGGLVTSTFITLFLIPTLYHTVETRIEGRKK